jgi:uracil-DNA glycosylase
MFLVGELSARPTLRAVLALGRIAHESVLRALGERLAAHPFAHGTAHDLGRLTLHDSYHCSRYNTNTGVLTPAMFEAVFARIREDLGPPVGA